MAGWTREKKMWWEANERRKRREYMEQMAQRALERAERIETVGMLLDAKWLPEYQVFYKRTSRAHANGLDTYWDTYYNEVGEEVPRPKGYNSV